MAFERFGPYRVVRQLGRGGMGAVYEGLDESTGERRAIKVLAPIYADDPDFRSRFNGEIEALKQLDHPNIVSLRGYGEQDGHLFYTMDLVSGPNLQEELQKGRRFSWKDVVSISLDVCSALKHAHDRGVIHRDLKPANLLVAEEGRVMLTDFGIAKLFGGGQLTMAGGIIGTADYMAPEQAEGRPVSARSDLYSLGSVMYALLAHRPPFSSQSRTAVLNSLLHERPQPLHRLAPGVPTPLEELIDQLLAKDPAERVPTALALTTRLKALRFGLEAEEVRTEQGDTIVGDDSGEMEYELRDPDRTEVSYPTRAAATGAAAARGGLAPADYGKETVAAAPTGASPSPAAAKPTEVTMAPRSAPTVYTTVEEGRRRSEKKGKGSTAREHSKFPAVASTLALVGLLVVAIAFGWYASLPPSADKLYGQIATIAGEGDFERLIDVRAEIDRFLELYPQDPRGGEVGAWRDDHDWYKAWRRLEREARKLGGVGFLGACESRFVEAARLENSGDHAKAREQYERLVADFADAEGTDVEYRDIAQQRAGKLQGELDATSSTP